MGKQRASLTMTGLRLAQSPTDRVLLLVKVRTERCSTLFQNPTRLLWHQRTSDVSEGFVGGDIQSAILPTINNLLARPAKETPADVCRSVESLPCLRQGLSSPKVFLLQLGSLFLPSRHQMKMEKHSPPGRNTQNCGDICMGR